MIVKMIGLVLLFIVRIKILRRKLITDTIRNRYDEAHFRKIQRFEKCYFKLRKCYLDLRFLLDCKKSGVIPKFLLNVQEVLNQIAERRNQIKVKED